MEQTQCVVKFYGRSALLFYKYDDTEIQYSSAYYYANQRLIIAQYVVKHHWRFLLIAQDHNIVLSFAQQRPNWLCALSLLINLWRKTTVDRTFVFVLLLYNAMFILENKLNYYYKFVEFMKFMRNISKLIRVSIIWIWF